MSLRVAVVGLDHYHVTGWVETLEGFADDFEIVALNDPDPDRGRALAPSYHDPALRATLGERYRGVPFETRLDDLIARHRPDVALVTLPNAEAPAAVEMLAAAGVHLLIDKPGARSEPEIRRAVEAVRVAGVRTVVGLTRRYSPLYREARAVVASGRLGRLIAVEAVFATSTVAVRDPANPLFDAVRSGGGILSWLGVHDIDALLWLTDQPIVEVSAMTANVGHPGLGVEDVGSVAIRFEGGALGTIQHAYALPARGYRGHLALRGTEASVEVGLGDDLVVLTRDANGDLHEARTSHALPAAPGYGPEGREAVTDLLKAIRENRPTMAPIDLLGPALAVVDAAYESARTRHHIRLDEPGGTT